MGEKTIIEYGGQTYELAPNEVLAIKVALPRNQRTGKFRFKDFGKVEIHSKWLYEVNKDVNRKKKQGHWGWMTVDDYEKKDFGPYGLAEVAKKMDDYTKAISLEKENSSLQDELLKKDQEKADLLAIIAELEGKKDGVVAAEIEPKGELVGAKTEKKESTVKPEKTDK